MCLVFDSTEKGTNATNVLVIQIKIIKIMLLRMLIEMFIFFCIL